LAVQSLKQIVPQLERSLNPAGVRALALRIRINTGVNIVDPAPNHVSDPASLAKVCAALQSMGHPVS
jgi:hypothetical protein